jgi:hypothetical protein
VAVLDVNRLRDADLHAIANAIDKGTQRIGATRTSEARDQMMNELGVDGWRRHSLHELVSSYSLAALLFLGGGAAAADLDAWGMAALPLTGCVCSQMVLPGRWRLLTGRPQTTLLAAAIPDLNLHVALTLHELGMPAPLARHVLASATLDFIEEVSPRGVNDWWTLVRAARRVPRTRIEDYVAAAAAVGGPLVPADPEASGVTP